MFYIWGFTSAFTAYCLLSHFFPATETLIPATLHEDVETMDGVEYKNDGLHTPVEVGTVEKDEKGAMNDVTDSV
jgi:NCS1 family nucleobase:cation symporter-1